MEKTLNCFISFMSLVPVLTESEFDDCQEQARGAGQGTACSFGFLFCRLRVSPQVMNRCKVYSFRTSGTADVARRNELLININTAKK